MELQQRLATSIDEHIEVFQAVRSGLLGKVQHIGEVLWHALEAGHKVLVAGNGGSAADAQHFAAELVGRYMRERAALAAIALTTDSSILTAVGNDYGFDQVFSRQVEGLGRLGDVFIGISTSGKSPNLLRAFESAAKKGVKTIALTGKGGGPLAEMADLSLVVPSNDTPRIQEAHQWIWHTWCEIIDHHYRG